MAVEFRQCLEDRARQNLCKSPIRLTGESTRGSVLRRTQQIMFVDVSQIYVQDLVCLMEFY